MRKRVFFISTERYSDFNSLIERYEQEMRKLFEEQQKSSGFEKRIMETMAPAKESDSDTVRETLPQETAEGSSASSVPDGTGNIIVEVTTGRGAVPIYGATVVIDRFDTDDEKGRQELVAIETTNQSGRTRSVAVNTVSRELSLEPGNTEPFSTFYVTADEKNFEPVKSRPVDVFANEVSILKIDLVPKPEKLSGGGTNG